MTRSPPPTPVKDKQRVMSSPDVSTIDNEAVSGNITTARLFPRQKSQRVQSFREQDHELINIMEERPG